jgi:type IV pilus assembly protein PilA
LRNLVSKKEVNMLEAISRAIQNIREKKGFTLVELLVVVAIIGILAAIAIPQFAAYRKRAYNSAAESDLRNFKTAMEGYYADNQQYPAL